MPTTLPSRRARALARACSRFEPDHDGVVVPLLVATIVLLAGAGVQTALRGMTADRLADGAAAMVASNIDQRTALAVALFAGGVSAAP